MNDQFVRDKIAWEKEREMTIENTLPRAFCRDAGEHEGQGLGRDIERAIRGEPYQSRADKGRFAR